MAFMAFRTAQPTTIPTSQGRRAVVVCRATSQRHRTWLITCAALLLGLLLLATCSMLQLPVGRRLILGAGLATAVVSVPTRNARAIMSPIDIVQRQGEIRHTEEEWKEILGASYNVLRREATELPFTSPLNNEKRTGTFVCAGCGSPLYSSTAKYNSGTGWPSFYEALPGSVDEVPDLSIPFYPRTEIRCHKCQGHTGHVFDDGPRPTGLRYCMNGLALKFVPAEQS